MQTRLCAVSVDLDELPNYFALHGLAPPAAEVAHLVYDVAVPRLLRFARSLEIPLTLFVIGADLARDENRGRVREASAAGHEIGNHSLDHAYDFSRSGPSEIRKQVLEGSRRIEEVVGRAPRGFRAPGYTIDDRVFEVLHECGVAYDSSVFPCPPYYLAKTAARLWIRARGRRSHAVSDTPWVLAAPTTPYRVGKPYWRRGTGLLEIPIQVTRGLRLPYIGTALTLAGPSLARALTAGVVGEKLVNLELHGLDFLDVNDGLHELHGHQPDLRVRVSRKLETLDVVVQTLKRAGYGFVTLEAAAERF